MHSLGHDTYEIFEDRLHDWGYMKFLDSDALFLSTMTTGYRQLPVLDHELMFYRTVITVIIIYHTLPPYLVLWADIPLLSLSAKAKNRTTVYFVMSLCLDCPKCKLVHPNAPGTGFHRPRITSKKLQNII
ncbi:hypothetical protein ARMSODRAFT_980992 [Armillaria solidipes]|uniref:Uncharacterized protein n=1 Tax=Armillaria solidipes TaxID=1076256 RepID=A0A2H3BBN4_9AGAR|nr:hypothetical protein ARMSODRAFT_980992 [Armillaria solidipes]